jgi:hypothetical protein
MIAPLMEIEIPFGHHQKVRQPKPHIYSTFQPLTTTDALAVPSSLVR